MGDYEDLAEQLFFKRYPSKGDMKNAIECAHKPIVVAYMEKEDLLALVDRRAGMVERRDKEWAGFRNYLYGYEHAILAERIADDYALMLIDASRDRHERLAKEFFMLTLAGQCEVSAELQNDPVARQLAEYYAHPERRHCTWGRVVVENGKPIGLMVKGDLVRQPITKPWREYSEGE